MKHKNKCCGSCPSRDGQPSPLAIERIHALQTNKKVADLDTLPGCQWAINSAEHQYCFWDMTATISVPVDDNEIRQLLCLSKQQLKEIEKSALSKLQAKKDSPLMVEFQGILRDKIAANSEGNGYTVEHTINEEVVEEKDENEIVDEILSKRSGINYAGQPLHRDGKKVDLYGLYTKKDKAKK